MILVDDLLTPSISIGVGGPTLISSRCCAVMNVDAASAAASISSGSLGSDLLVETSLRTPVPMSYLKSLTVYFKSPFLPGTIMPMASLALTPSSMSSRFCRYGVVTLDAFSVLRKVYSCKSFKNVSTCRIRRRLPCAFRGVLSGVSGTSGV